MRPDEPVLVLNPDIRLEPGAVQPLLRALDDAAVGIAVPRLVSAAGETAPSLRREPSLRGALCESLLGGRRAGRAGHGELVVGERAYARAHDVDWATGAAWLISPRCRRDVGAWDESFFLYSEETDYALRAHDAGYRVRYCPDAVATHLGGEGMTSPSLYALMARNRVRLFRKRNGRVAALAFRGALAAGELLRSVRPSRTHRAALRALTRGAVDDPRPARGWVCFAAVDWWYHNTAHSELQLMRSMALREPVLVVNSIGVRAPVPGRTGQFSRRVIRKARSMLRRTKHPVADRPNFAVMTPFFLPVYGSGLLATANAALVRRQVRREARRLGMVRPACLVTVPTAAPIVEGLGFRHVIYNRSDKHSEMPGVNRPLVERMESTLLRDADHVVYVSQELMDEDRQLSGDRAVFLDHGVDLEHFRRVGRAPALADVDGPVVGFFGGINEYTVDVALLKRVALEVDATLVLAGDITADVDGLVELPNVRWLGHRPYAEIPAIGSAFDVALMPWQDNEWIRRCNPIKLKEYLALGLPVVSTFYPEVEKYAGLVGVARSHDEFISLVRTALDAARGDVDGPRSRREAVLTASWDSKADVISELAHT
ncbi:glycosyltransferase [Georgenia sp.]